MAVTMAAREVFMSAAPRPYSRPSRSVGTNGSDSHWSSGPVGTTSVCPAKQTSGAPVPRRAQRFVTPLLSSGSSRKPSALQSLAEHGLAAGVLRRHRAARDQRARKFKGIAHAGFAGQCAVR